MDLISQAEEWLLGLAQQVALPWFVVIGAAVEEIIAPIPSPLVMTAAGSIAKAQGASGIYLVVLAILGGFAKTAASWLVYVISDRAEDVVVGKWGKWLGVSSKEVEDLGKYFGNGVKDTLVIFLARVIPIMPTAPVSVACGVIKVNLKSYLAGTLLGTIGRSLIYLWLGFAGLASLESILHGLDSAEKVIQLVLVLGLGLGLGWLFWKRRRETDMMGRIRHFFGMD